MKLNVAATGLPINYLVSYEYIIYMLTTHEIFDTIISAEITVIRVK